MKTKQCNSTLSIINKMLVMAPFTKQTLLTITARTMVKTYEGSATLCRKILRELQCQQCTNLWYNQIFWYNTMVYVSYIAETEAVNA